MTKKLPLATEDGDVVPVAENQDVASIIYLLEWGRRRGFRLGPMIQVGDTTVQVRDTRLDDGKPSDLPPETDIWAEHGHREE